MTSTNFTIGFKWYKAVSLWRWFTPSWIIGPQHTFAWYRYKKHALEATARYNKD